LQVWPGGTLIHVDDGAGCGATTNVGVDGVLCCKLS
jgi:hypothetical protein